MVKNLLANAGNIRDVSLIPGSGRPSGGGHDNPLPVDQGAWQAAVHGVTESDKTKQLNNKNNKQEIMIIRIRSHWSLSTICYSTEVQEVRSGDTQPPPRCPFTESDSSLIPKGWVLTSGVLVLDFLPGHGDLTKGRIVA